MHTNGYHSHTHNHCNHDIAYCQICDICYCTKCNREWGRKVVYEYKYEPYIWTYQGVPYTVTFNNGDYSLTTSNGTVVKNNNVISAFYSSSNSSHAHNTK